MAKDFEKIIFDSEFYTYDDAKKYLIEEQGIENPTDDEIYDEINECNRIAFKDDRFEFACRGKDIEGTIIAIGGCMMQEKHIVDKLKQSYPFFDIVFGTHTLQEFSTDLYNVLCNKKRIEDILDIDGDVIEGLPISREDKIFNLETIEDKKDLSISATSFNTL